MNTTTLFFFSADAIAWVKDNTNVNIDAIEASFEKFKYVQQSVFKNVLNVLQFAAMKCDLIWFTQNDITNFEGATELPNLYVLNPRTPATCSLVQAIDNKDGKVQFKHITDLSQSVYELTNREFILNTQKV